MIDAVRLRAEADRAAGIARRILDHPANAAHPGRALLRACGWQVRKRLWRRPVDVDFEGFTLRCHRDSSSASNVWYFTSRYDHAEMTFLDRYLRPGDHALDIGANIGTYSLFMAARVGPAGRISAIEAEPRAAARLRHNISRNRLTDVVDVHEVAVDRVAGTVPFFVERDVANGIAVAGDPRGVSIAVPAVRLDDLVEPTERLSVAKLDVEGVEVRALAGAPALLGRRLPPVWITEVMGPQLRWFGATVDDLYDAFAEVGYEPCSYDVANGRLRRERIPIKGNVIFVATARFEEVERRLGEGNPT